MTTIIYLLKGCMIYFKLKRLVRYHPRAKDVGFPAHKIVSCVQRKVSISAYSVGCNP